MDDLFCWLVMKDGSKLIAVDGEVVRDLTLGDISSTPPAGC